jgi:GNAT superfamily N-acetyltransferase
MYMGEIIIRKAEIADLETLLRFEQGIVSEERPFNNTLKSGLIHYYDIEELIKATHAEVVVAELDGEIIGSGFARIDMSEPYLAHAQHAWFGFMFVEPQHRGKGVVSKIIEVLKQWSVAQGMTVIRLDVYSGNVSAIKAYEKAGFTSSMIEMRMGI